MNAEIIAVGSELLTPTKIDTNSLWLTDQLNMLGVEVILKSIVADDRTRLTGQIAGALTRADIVLITGGLGPTEDDVTRDAAAAALGLGQTYHQEIVDQIAAMFVKFGRKNMAENNKRQAFVLDGAEVLHNPRGTAPGQWIAKDGRVVVLLPGPPREMNPLFEEACVPRIKKMLPPIAIRTRFYRVAGMGESDLDQLIAPVYTKYTNPATTILASPGDIHIHLRARCDNAGEAEALLTEVAAPILELLGDRVYSDDGADLETSVGRKLKAKGAWLAVAESCTGGLIGERITSVSGSSGYFKGGFIPYTAQMKHEMVGVPLDVLASHTAVSEPVAIAMAQGAKAGTGADYALSVTGYAGPDAGEDGTPAGVVWIGLAFPEGAEAKRFQLWGDRERVRTIASIYALDWLRKKLS